MPSERFTCKKEFMSRVNNASDYLWLFVFYVKKKKVLSLYYCLMS